jgi:tetratricopeptide (TPR) repeat protein
LALDYLVIALSALAPAMAGAAEFPTQVPLLTAAALLMALDPRRAAARVPWPVIGLALLLVALGASAFLPGSWLGGAAVKTRLEEALELELSTRVTLQPWLTLEALLVLGTTLLWGHYLFTRSWTLRRAHAVGVYCGLIALLAVASLASFALGWRPPFWPANIPFGPCPNYNETGFVFGTAAVLCFCLAFRKTHQLYVPGRTVLWLGVFLVLGAALIFNRSRSGILIFLGGPLAWLLACVGTKQMKLREAAQLGLAVGLAGVLFLIFGGAALKRFGDVPETLAGDYRVLVQKDALQLARAASLVGVGVGNFNAVFPFYRDASWNQKRALHPEGDWVAFAAELGWLAVPIIWALLAWGVRRAVGEDGQSERPIMLAAGVVGVALWLHGFVDMNAHRLGAVWPVLFCLAVSQPRSAEPDKYARSLAWRIGLAGLSLVLLAAWLGPTFKLNFPGTMLRRQLDARFDAAVKARDFAQARQLCDDSLALAPLDWRPYFQRAFVTLARRGEVNDAVVDFSRARALEPNAPDLPLLEARYWWEHGWPEQTELALEEAFRRGGFTEAMFDHVFKTCRHDPGLIRALLGPAAREPATQLRYLRDAPPALFTEMLALVLRGSLDTWSEARRALLFRLWAGHAEGAQLPDYLAAHPEQLAAAWPALARVLMQQGKAEAVCELISRWQAPPKLPELESSASLAALHRRLELNAADYGAVFLLATRLRESGELDAASQVLAHGVARPTAPAYLHYLRFQLHAARREWGEAAASWQRFDETVLQAAAKSTPPPQARDKSATSRATP